VKPKTLSTANDSFWFVLLQMQTVAMLSFCSSGRMRHLRHPNSKPLCHYPPSLDRFSRYQGLTRHGSYHRWMS